MKPLASVSLDLDNLWSYMKVHGDAGWEAFPSFLDRAIPRALDVLARVGLRATFMVVGQDAAIAKNREALARIPAAGHEVGNHSFAHEPWLHRYTEAEVEDEIGRAEDAIRDATGAAPVGFRGPGYSLSSTVLRVISRRGYAFDASTLPTFIGPLARAYYFATARLAREQREERAALFGSVRDGLRPVRAYRWDVDGRPLVEIPVTTFPVVRAPFHPSYVMFLATYSPVAARAYFRSALLACRAAGVEPSVLLHPLDVIGPDDAPELAFFPAMRMPFEVKVGLLEGCLRDLASWFDVLPMGEHARRIGERSGLATRPASAADTPH
ncbi:MAG: polysaccharide deacetylase family protein [Deltaproteobacteria bacterium]|nr:polysaccharide deacetylase family protein [Deltaproteobacteria bacterium]